MFKGINRRDFFKVAAVSGATAAVASCGTDPVEELVPMLVPPSDYVPGVSIHFATTCQECSSNCGMVVRTREGRAIKVEGNPNHPLSEGRLCAVGQSTLQGLYSPSRVTGPKTIENGSQTAISWEKGKNILAEKLVAAQEKGSRILYIGTPKTGVLNQLQQDWLEAMGGGTAIGFDTAPTNSIRKANDLTFGKAEIPHYAIENADYLLNFGADFLESWLYSLKLTRGYTKMHAFKHGQKGKFVHVSPHMSLTGSNADEWVSCSNGAEGEIALAVANTLLAGSTLPKAEKDQLESYLSGYSVSAVANRTGVPAAKIKELAKEFGTKGKSLALAGGNSTASQDGTKLQIAVNVLNYIGGNIGKTVLFGADYQDGANSIAEMEAAIKGMQKGQYDVVIIENVNPAYALPKDSKFTEALQKVPFVVSFSTEADETSALAKLHLPISHYLESWGDSRPRTGIYSLQQPTMATVPGYDTVELGDLFIQLAEAADNDTFEDYDNFQALLKESWEDVQSEVENSQAFVDFWKKALQKGGHFSDFTTEDVAFDTAALSHKPGKAATGLTLIAANSSLHSAGGKNGNRTWMLEIPHPITQIVWDSWVEINPDTAIKLGIRHGDLVEVSSPYGKVEVAAWLYYGIAENTVAMPAGLGRVVPMANYKTSHGQSAWIPVIETAEESRQTIHNVVGVNVMELLPFQQDGLSGDLNFASTQVTVKPTGRKAYLVTPDGQYRDDIEALQADAKAGMGDRSQKGRGFVQTASMGAMLGLKEDGKSGGHQLRHRVYTTDLEDNTSFYETREKDIEDAALMAGKTNVKYYDTYKWGMTIDLDRCTGCSACMVACYAENNLPVVGKDRMGVGREMSWLRVERYFDKNKETGKVETYFTPEMCGQCENAGCEPVCPVYATYHTPDGINAMVYNRCVGTRYCANNCVYKQRRFNWRDYEFPSPLHLQLNPGATVREKGVMEKCNFCYTRIREIKDIAKDEGREVYDGELQTACQQTCGADAITFGNVKDSKSEVSQIKKSTKRGYIQLEELAFLPAITYLKKVKHNNHKA
ncbi:MAG: oxidoreductase [SAR324 cluster bacterium]|uniref:Oxidoreductase n=1 Tax=SAR324 cluster bacterium TaxID=2024889 RepID=A0A2A4TBP6_9DELT|nr:MAG: oxidoreductase [SAR324 cluster bacterium]